MIKTVWTNLLILVAVSTTFFALANMNDAKKAKEVPTTSKDDVSKSILAFHIRLINEKPLDENSSNANDVNNFINAAAIALVYQNHCSKKITDEAKKRASIVLARFGEAKLAAAIIGMEQTHRAVTNAFFCSKVQDELPQVLEQ